MHRGVQGWSERYRDRQVWTGGAQRWVGMCRNAQGCSGMCRDASSLGKGVSRSLAAGAAVFLPAPLVTSIRHIWDHFDLQAIFRRDSLAVI